MKKALLTLSLVSLAVSQAFAQLQITVGNGATTGSTAGAGTQAGSSILGLLALAQTLVARLVPFLIGLAVVVFFIYLVMFLIKGNQDGTKRAEYMKGMVAAVIALFVMVSVWGLVGFLGSFLGVGQGGSAPTPSIPLPQ